MNVAWTRAAEGFPRRAFSVDDIRRMIEAGVLGEGERIELIGGELVVMAAKSVLHDNVQNALNLVLVRVAPDGFYVGNGSTLQLADDVLVEPDLAVISRAVYDAQDPNAFARPTRQDVLLIIEVSVTSLAYDLGIKASQYARHAIGEYWVIDANRWVAHIHTGPNNDGTWQSIVERGPGDVLGTRSLPGLALKLSEIG